jgi:hypothetical protein
MRAAKKRNLLPEAKVRKLDQIGFTWSIDPRHIWEQRFQELAAFKKQHGHCNVPRGYPVNRPLAYWVDNVRRRRKQGKLAKKTIRRLDKLGFCWSLLHRRFQRRDLDEFVATIRAFKKRHGHCDLIAARAGADRDLLFSLKDVRKSKKQGRLDPRYVRQLDRLGFVWEPRKQRRQEMYSAWLYSALLHYRKRYGDCRVPGKWPKNRRLASWVSRMRTAKKRNLLTKAQIQELDHIGFAWDSEPQQKRERIWQQRVQELKAFKSKYGHCNVPWKYRPNAALAKWVSCLRRGKRHGTLAKDRIRCLAALGFRWDMSKGKKPPRKPRKIGSRAKRPKGNLRKYHD